MLKTTNRAVSRRRPTPVHSRHHASTPDADARYLVSSEVRLEARDAGWILYPAGAAVPISVPDSLCAVLRCFCTPVTPEQAFQYGSHPLESGYDEFLEAIGRLVALRFLVEDLEPPGFERPVLIVSAPRAGGTLLFEALAGCCGVWTANEEGAGWIDRIAPDGGSDRLAADEINPRIAGSLLKLLSGALIDCQGNRYGDRPRRDRPGVVRFLDQDLRHGLRIPFLRALFPTARFVFLYRDPRESIASILAGWRSGKFVVHRRLPGWSLRCWSFPRPPGWHRLKPESLAEIAAFQWTAINTFILDDLENAPTSARLLIPYADLVAHPETQIRRVCRFAGVESPRNVSRPLPSSGATLSLPDANKWRRHESEIRGVLPMTETVVNRVAMWA